MFGMNIRGFIANELLIVEKKEIKNEWYISIMLDRVSKKPLLIFSSMGGMDIEETARVNPEKIARIPLDPFRGAEDYTIEYIFNKTGADKQYKNMIKELINKLFSVFFDYCTLLVEINPLAIDESGNLVAMDGKVEIDDNALPLLPEAAIWKEKLQEDNLVIEAEKLNFHLVPIDKNGIIGVMSNGSGMLMSCIDLISQKNISVGAALDLGGGAIADRISEAILLMFRYNNIDTIFICIFGGITRCDEVAKGACAAMRTNTGTGKNLILRMEGTNKDEALRIVSESGLSITATEGIPNSVDAICKLKGP